MTKPEPLTPEEMDALLVLHWHPEDKIHRLLVRVRVLEKALEETRQSASDFYLNSEIERRQHRRHKTPEWHQHCAVRGVVDVVERALNPGDES